MNRTPVKSSFVSEVGYDEAHQILEIKLSSGRIYQYFDVPAEVVAELTAAKSFGAVYNYKITRGGFASRRATELEAPPAEPK